MSHVVAFHGFLTSATVPWGLLMPHCIFRDNENTLEGSLSYHQRIRSRDLKPPPTSLVFGASWNPNEVGPLCSLDVRIMQLKVH